MKEQENKSIYQENGYENRKDYLKCLSEEYGVDLYTVQTLADVLGQEEDFDGLVAELNDLEYIGGKI